MPNVPISGFTVPANTVGIGLTGYSLTGSSALSMIDLAGTWNTSGTPTALKLNVTNTASAAASLLMDLQVGGSSRFRVRVDGTVVVNSSNLYTDILGSTSNANSGIKVVGGGGRLTGNADTLLSWNFNSSTSPIRVANGIGFGPTVQASDIVPDLILSRRGAANLRLGAADAAAPVAQTLSVQSGTAGASATTVSISGTALTIAGTVTGTIAIGHAVTGTGVSAGTLITAGSGTSWTVNNSQTVGPITAYFNSVGRDLTITGSQGSGPSAGGSIIFQVAPAGSAATTAQNALVTQFQINGSGGVTGQDGATANTIALRNGANAQTFRVYNTFTDASNYERLDISWSANVAMIQTQGAGSGATNRRLDIFSGGQLNLASQAGSSLFLFTNGSARWYFDGASGHLLANTDNAVDIGAAAATRPRNVFIAGYNQLSEMTAPAAPAANGVRIYAEDNGSGKTRLMALFATGAAQQIAIEP